MTILLGLGLVAACAEIDRPALDALAPAGEGFAAHLARAYKTQAMAADQAGDGTAAARFGAKALNAGAGLIDGPDPISDRVVAYVRAENFDNHDRMDAHAQMPGQNRPPHPWVDFEEDGIRVPRDIFPAMAEARKRLIEALARGARHHQAAETAAAQAVFDCWAGRAATGAGETCRAELSARLARLEAATSGKGFFVEAPDSGTLRPCPKAERLTRHYSLTREAVLTADVAEVLDRARLESAAGQACSETPVR